MQLDCPRCGRTLEYSDKRPSFCAYCGKPLPVPLAATAAFDDEAATLPPTEPEPFVHSSAATCICGYRLVRPLGTGGMGTVYEAEEIDSGRRVALKLIAPEFAGSQETVARFRQEGLLASQVVHPRCVFVHKADEEDGRPYIVMELMPGSTLQDLVLDKGPLAAEDAVAKILDVIDGLQEAHRLGIIHRDVKPSNCFLEADGRVKVGDFGLSRSLMSDARLTRAGAFLGTPLYAAPEQIRADPVDQQSDVYSVAATLYFLLAGRAPHQTGDAAATMARIVSEPAPPLRETRPELSPTLDDVVLRGLERDRGRRWANLEEFRQALLPFGPRQLPAAGRAVRFAAFVIDSLLLAVIQEAATLFLAWILSGSPWDYVTDKFVVPFWLRLLLSGFWIGYFGFLEGNWGASLGKRLFRLRVTVREGFDPPALARALLRAAVLYLLLYVTWLFDPLLGPFDAANLFTDWRTTLFLGGGLLGLPALLCTMRARNGYRLLHDWVSDTRVVSLVSTEQRLVIPARLLEQEVTRKAGLPEQLGPFTVLGVLADGPRRRVLLGQDPVLGRKAVILSRPADGALVSQLRQELARGSRLRWLTGGGEGRERWDAFVAPAGCALADLVAHHGRLPWVEVRPLLDQLTQELLTAKAEGNLPDILGTDQVWVQPDGRVCLLEFPLQARSEPPAVLDDARPELPLVRETATLALEGEVRSPWDGEERFRAPLPLHAAETLQHLFCEEALERVRDDLAMLRDQPSQVTTRARLVHLQVLGLLLATGLFCLFALPTVVLLQRVQDSLQLAYRAEAVARMLRTQAAALAAAGVRPDPWGILGIANLLDDKLMTSRSLEEHAVYGRQMHEAQLHLVGVPLRRFVQANLLTRAEVETELKLWAKTEAALAEEATDIALEKLLLAGPLSSVVFVLLYLTIPALWIGWAYLTRGGVSYRLTNLALVRSDGRPAARWQCGLRALFVWAPFAGLLCLSALLESSYLAASAGGTTYVWVAWLSWVSWWLALLLLPTYALLALWSPERSLHDRMVGTYLVPR